MTAERWRKLLRRLGHRATVATEYRGQPADLLIALHAWRSADAVQRSRAERPDRPIIVGLAGTDIYHYLDTEPDVTRAAIEAANFLVGLHDRVGDALPESQRDKLRVIHQSAEPVKRRPRPSSRHFDVCVVAHLREVKDPLRAAAAVRGLPKSSRLRVLQLGGAREPGWAERAEREAKENDRLVWKGNVSARVVRRTIARSRLLVLSSRFEGGANVISEALAAGTPILASRIAGNVGLLGDDYPGYFPVADTAALRALLLNAENQPAFLSTLRHACARRAPLFTPQRETEAWRALLAEIV